MVEITIIAAFIAGIVSFLSPCVLPLIPAFLGYLSGTSLEEAKRGQRFKIFTVAVFFVLGFSVVFSLLGVLLNTVLEAISFQVLQWLGYVGGIIIIIFGLYIVGLVKIKFLEREHKLTVKKKFSNKYFTAFVFGAAFAVGWTPCVGAILGAVLALSITQPGIAFGLLLAYSIGLGIPFLLLGAFSTEALRLISRSERFLKYFNIVVGILLIILGILVFTQQLSRIANIPFLNQILLG